MASNPPAENPPNAGEESQPLTSGELLPPVEPPSAGFILRLFVIPAVIVLAVVMLWLLISMLASRGDEDPKKIVAELRSSNQSRWQQADKLANMLRLEKRYPALKRNSQLASELAKLLDEEVDSGRDDENSIKLRYFLSRALGEFYVDDGLSVLLKAALTDKERDIRREAVNAVAVLGHTFSALDPPQDLAHPELNSTLLSLADDPDDLIRSQTAFALGVFATSGDADPRLIEELEVLVEDLYTDARFNAALGLARQGNLRAAEAVAEMFSAEALRLATAKEKLATLQGFKRNTILRNALDATDMLLEKNPAANLEGLLSAVEEFVASGPTWQPDNPVPEVLIKRAQSLLDKHA